MFHNEVSWYEFGFIGIDIYLDIIILVIMFDAIDVIDYVM